MSAERQLTWENFLEDFLSPGVPASHPIAGSPPLEIYFRPTPARIGLSVPWVSQGTLPPNPYREINVGLSAGAHGRRLNVETSNRALFQTFYSLLLEIADAIQVEAKDPLEAILLSVARFAEVIKTAEELSTEEAVGYWGELWTLEALLRSVGAPALKSWTGCHKDQHDFRISATELEVKTTLGSQPEHVIHGLAQLRPSDGFQLYLLSLQVLRADIGLTLRDRIGRIKALLVEDPVACHEFDEACNSAKMSPARIAMSSLKLALRCAPKLVAVNDLVPKLLPEPVAALVGKEPFARLLDVNYRINVEGLGVGASSELFQRVTPWLSSEQ